MVWKEIHNVQIDYLKPIFIVVTTTIKDDKSSTYKRMHKWCEKLHTKWGVGCLEEYDYFYTFRFWTESDAEDFAKKFKKYVTNTEMLFSKK